MRELLAAGADPNARASSQGLSALHCAASRVSPKIVRALLEGGASPTARNQQGNSVLAYAKSSVGALERDAEGMVQARVDATMALLRAATDRKNDGVALS